MPFNFLEFLSFRMISIPIRCLLSMRLKTELLFYFFTQTADHHHSSLLSRPLGFRIKLSPNGLIPEYKLFMRCRCCNRKYGSSFYFVYLFNFFSHRQIDKNNPPHYKIQIKNWALIHKNDLFCGAQINSNRPPTNLHIIWDCPTDR